MGIYFNSSAIIDLFLHEVVRYVNMLGASMKLSVFCEGNSALIVAENDDGLRVTIIRPEQLIEEFLEPYGFLYRLGLGHIFGFACGCMDSGLTFR